MAHCGYNGPPGGGAGGKGPRGSYHGPPRRPGSARTWAWRVGALDCDKREPKAAGRSRRACCAGDAPARCTLARCERLGRAKGIIAAGRKAGEATVPVAQLLARSLSGERPPKVLTWVGVHDRLPCLYEPVIVCYIGKGTSGWDVGGGFRHEEGWTVETDSEEDVGPFAVCAWMDWPDPPEVALRGAVQTYGDTTGAMRDGGARPAELPGNGGASGDAR